MTERICSACWSVVPWMFTRLIAATVMLDRELDRVVGPGELLLALHLLGELRHPPLQLVGVAEQSSEAFHAAMVAPVRCRP